jgi:hypothetical protein
MNEERPFLQLPLPTQDDQRFFEEWLKEKEEKEEKEGDSHIIIIDI